MAFTGPAVADQVVAAAKKINGKNLKTRSIAGNRLRNNTITGIQVKESSLGKVPSASKADSATNATTATNATNATNASTVGGLTVKRISYKRTAVTGPEEILNLAGVKLTASCAAAGNTNLEATTSKQDSSAFVAGMDGDDANDANTDASRDIDSDDRETETFDTTTTFDLDSQIGQGTANSETGWFHYYAQDGSSVAAQLVLDESGTECVVYGVAIGG